MQYGQEVTKSSKEFPKLYQLHGGEIITLPPHLSNQICPNQLESLLLYRLPTKVGGNNRATSLIQQPTITFNPHSFPSPYTPNHPFTIMSLALRILFHAYEPIMDSLASRIEQSGKTSP